MYTRFKNTIPVIVFLLVAMIMTPAANAQRIVSASVNTVMLGPPYNVPFDQLKEKIRITVLCNASLEGVYLEMIIRGDNGIVIQTNGNQVEQFYVGGGVPLIIPNSDQNLDLIFQQQNLSFSNINPNTLYTYGLPSGHYQVCFRLWNMSGTGPAPLSPAAPAGCADFSIQQVGLNLSTVVQPPFDADFLQYYDKTMVTLSTGQFTRINLRMTLKGNNGISISTAPGYVQAQLTELEPNVPVMLSSQDLWDLFVPGHLVFSGITRQEVENKGLPEGTYRLCFTAYNEDGIPVSGNDPVGCSAPFSIHLLDPPVILAPVCGKVISQGAAQPVLFNWTPSPGAPPGTPYTLRIVQMDNPDVPPGDALLTATTPAFFETTVLGTSFLYGPAQPVLEEGKKYAFEIIAGTESLNISNPFDFDAAKLRFKNNGRSVPCYFEYAGPGLVFTPGAIIKETGPEYSQIAPDANILPFSTVSGQLNYKFKGLKLTLGMINFPSGEESSNSKPANGPVGDAITQSNSNFGLVQNSPQTVQTGQLASSLGYIDPEGSTPLANVRVSLVVRYVMRSGSINGKEVAGYVINRKDFALTSDEKYGNKFPGDGMVLKTTYTAADGTFSFTFVNADTTMGKNSDLEVYHSGEFGDQANGQVYKTMRLIVDNKYYCSPDVDIHVKPWEGAELGTLVSWVKSYNLKVNVKSTTATFYDQSMGSGSPLNDVSTKVLRQGYIPGVPYNEGSIKSGIRTMGGQKKLVEEGTSDGNGEVLFLNLVMHDPDNNSDRYFISCTTSETSGNINYKDLEKRYNPIYLKDKKNFPFNSLAKELISSGNTGQGGLNLGPQYQEYGLGITFNSEFEVKTFQVDMNMYPKLPRVYGQAFVTGMKDLVNLNNTMTDTTKQGVKIYLFSQYSSDYPVPESEHLTSTLSIKSTWSDASGRYSFENLPLQFDSLHWKSGDPDTYKAPVKGPKRWLLTKPKGFGAVEKDLNILKYGDQVKADLMLYPDGIAMGYVVDEVGKPVKASVKTDGYPAVNTGEANFITALALVKANAKGLDQIPPKAQMFVFYAPSTDNAKITIIPDDVSSYATLDTSMRIAKMNDTQPETVRKFVVSQIKHRVKFRIKGYSQPPGKIQLPAKPLEGVKVKIGNILEDVSGVTDDQGYVTLSFLHSDTEFSLDVIPSGDSDYPVVHTAFKSFPGTKVVFIKDIVLYPGFRLKGSVTIGDDDQPADSARVYVEGNEDIFTYTDEKGKFELRKIPGEMKLCSVNADKFDPENAIIGDKKENISLPASSPVDLHLTVETGIPTELFGFPVVISTVEKQGNTAEISGALLEPEKISNANFSFKPGSAPDLKFSKVKLSKSTGGNMFKPEKKSFDLDEDMLQIVLNNAFMAVQHPVSGSLIRVEEGTGGKGVIRGKVMLKNSFQFNSSLFSFDNSGAWLAETGSPGNGVTVFRAPPDETKPGKFLITDPDGNDLKVTLKGFDGTVKKSASFVQQDTLNLSLQLTTKEIESISPSKIAIDIGNLKLTTTGFEEVKGTEKLNFALEKWTVESTNWSLSQASKGFTIESGILKTGMVDLPVKNIELTPSTFKIWEIELKQMTLGGVAPLTLQTNNTSFGYFPSIGKDQKGHWRLAVVGLAGKPAVTLAGLPGLKDGTELSFNTFAVLSNGEQSLTFTQGVQDLEFYSTLHVNPIAIYPYDGYFLLTGAMDLGIPRIEKQNGNIKFSKEGSALKFQLYPLNMDFEGPGKVRFYSSQKFGDQVFNNGVFAAPGQIRDEEGIKLSGILHRDKTSVWLEVDPYDQVLPIGSTGKTTLADIRGEMKVDNSENDWGLFTFTGTMNGVKGMEGDRKKTFTIYGDIVADNQDVKVKNIDTGFGNINITFDYKHARMLGDMDINKSFSGLSLHGVANMLVDGSGWYFLAGGQVEMPGLGDFQAGFMIGDYDVMPPDITGKIMQFAYNKEIPTAFNNHISGMFITGRKSLPIIDIPDISIDLWILSAKLGIDAGLDARLWMGFDGSGNEYGIAAMAFAHAYFVASSITCTSLSADARAELGAKGSYNTGSGAFTIGGCGSFTLSARIEQCFPTLIAGCEGCIGKTLNESIKVNMQFDSQGNTSLSFGFGNCSGQPALGTGY